jgi:hypothetical protein
MADSDPKPAAHARPFKPIPNVTIPWAEEPSDVERALFEEACELFDIDKIITIMNSYGASKI